MAGGDCQSCRQVRYQCAKKLGNNPYICEAIAEDCHDASNTSRDWWDQLLLRSLAKLEAELSRSPLEIFLQESLNIVNWHLYTSTRLHSSQHVCQPVFRR